MESMDKIVEQFIKNKIRGLVIRPVDVNPFSQVVRDEFRTLCRSIDHELVEHLLGFGDIALSKVTSSKDNLLFIQLYDYWAFHVDHHIEDHPKDAAKYVRYVKDRKCPEKDAKGRLLQLIFDESPKLVNEAFLNQHYDMTIEWLEGFPERQKLKESKPSDQEFTKLRMIDVHGTTQCVIFIVVSGLKVTDEIRANEDYQGVTEQVIKHCMIVNELFSFIREVSHGNGRFNLVFIRMEHKNLTVAQSVDQIVEEANQAEERAYIYANRLIASNNEGLANYAKKVINLMIISVGTGDDKDNVLQILDSLLSPLMPLEMPDTPLVEDAQKQKRLCELLNKDFGAKQKHKVGSIIKGLGATITQITLDNLSTDKFAICQLAKRNELDKVTAMAKEINRNGVEANKVRLTFLSALHELIEKGTKVDLSKLLWVYPDKDGAKEFVKTGMNHIFVDIYNTTFEKEGIKATKDCSMAEASTNPSNYNSVIIAVFQNNTNFTR